jgi:hypothetical protein
MVSVLSPISPKAQSPTRNATLAAVGRAIAAGLGA